MLSNFATDKVPVATQCQKANYVVVLICRNKMVTTLAMTKRHVL